MTPEMATELSKITERVVRGNWNSTNPPSSPPLTDTAEKLYLQIRICAEQYTGSKYVKKEYQIELPANVVGLDGEADIWEAKREGGTESMRYYLSTRELGAFVVIPVILQAPSSDSPEEVTPTAQWQETNRYERDGKTHIRKDRFIPG